MTRNFSPKDMTAERDANGHRTGMKLMVKERMRMQPSSFLRWGRKSRAAISKSKYVWRTYSSTRAIGEPNGVPVEVMANDKTLAEWCINRFMLADGCTYGFHGWVVGKTRTHVKLTRCLFQLTVHSADAMKYDFHHTGLLNRYFFRKDKKHKRRPFG